MAGRKRPAMDHGRIYGPQWFGLDAYERHKQLVEDYLRYYRKPGDVLPAQAEVAAYRTDKDVLQENWRFVRRPEDDAQDTWEQRLVKRYYDRLYKEYCLADLRHYKKGQCGHAQVGLRWRTEREVLEGKGQFSCGNLQCSATSGLRSWEVNFGYVEHGEKRNALVKLRLCPDCSAKLNYRKQMREYKHAGSAPAEASGGKRPRSEEAGPAAGGSRSDDHDGAAETPARAPETAEDEGAAGAEVDPARAHWKGPAAVTAVDRTREEEIEDYFSDLFQ